MAKLLKLRRGTTTQHASFTGAEGEVTIDTTKDTAVVHDGSQAGGRPLAREDMSNVSSASIAGRLGTDAIATSKIAGGVLPTDVTVASANLVDGTIVNADISGSAAIDASKISGLTLDKIYEGDSKVEVVDTGSATYVSTVVDNVEANRTLSSKATIFDSAYFGSQLNKTDGSGQGIGLLYGGGTSNVGIISCTHTNGLQIRNNSAIQLQQNGSPNNIYASFSNTGGSFSTSGTARFDYDGTNINFALNVLPDTDSNYDIGTSAKRFANAYVDAIDVTGDITVSGSVDGADVAAMNTKLSGIETAATADQTKSDIDALNINADTVDSLHASSFLRSDADDTIDATLTTRRINVQGNYDIRLASGSWTGEASAKIQYHSNHLYCQYNDSGSFIARDSAGNDNFTVDSSGNCTALGNVTAYSDARLKTDISTINDALGICGKLRGVSYKWLKDGSAGIGVIAQEVEEVIPEIVLTSKKTNPSTGEETEVKSVDYGKIVGVLINAINELKEEVEELKNAKITG